MKRRAHIYAPCLIAGSICGVVGCADETSTVDGTSEVGRIRAALTLPESFTPKTAAAYTGRLAGAAVAYSPLVSDPIYAATLAAEFSDITPENATKWGPLQPAQGVWDFSQADAIMSFAESNGVRVKGHTLAWHNQMPSFITSDIVPGRLNFALVQHWNEAVSHYAGQFFAWDAVNEAVADDGSGLRDSLLTQKLGDEWIAHAFTQAHAMDHDAKLYYNDYGIITINPKSDAVYQLLVDLLADDVPVHGVGMQGHIDARFAPSYQAMVDNFERFAALGLGINVSELDVRIADLAGTDAHRLAVQKQIYHRVSAACAAVPACEGVTTWGFTDAYSWIDSTFGADDPLLFDEHYKRKPAYYGYVDGFLGVPLDTSSSRPNLIANSSLEAGLDGWSQQGGAAIRVETTRANSGLRSVIHTGRTATWNAPRYSVTALSRSGYAYDVSVAASVAGAASAPVKLSAAITCAGESTTFVNIASGTASDTDWVELAGELQLPLCTLGSVAVYVEGPAAGIDVLADDLSYREQPLGNIVPNPDFEGGTTAGWFGFGPATVSATSDAHTGDYAAIATGRSATWQGIATNLTSLVLPGGMYQASAWVKISEPSDNVFLTAARRCAGEATTFARVGQTVANDVGYVEIAGSTTVPDCALEEFTLYAEGPQPGVDILIDDVSFNLVIVEPSENLLSNGDFETNTSGWFPFGPTTIATTTAQANSGNQSAVVSNRTATWQGMATSLVGIVSPGKSYPLQAFVRLSTGSGSSAMTLQLACDGGGSSFSRAASATANDTSWTELNGVVSIPPSCGTIDTANLYVEGAPAGVDIYLDDVLLTE